MSVSGINRPGGPAGQGQAVEPLSGDREPIAPGVAGTPDGVGRSPSGPDSVSAFLPAEPVVNPGFDPLKAAVRSSGLFADATLEMRLSPKLLDGWVLGDGSRIRVMRELDDYPDDAEVRRRWDRHYAVFEIRNDHLGYVAYVGIHRLTRIQSRTSVLDGRWYATGGTRIRNYREGALGALKDALELSAEMSFKAAGAGLRIAGSKCAIHVAGIDPSPHGPDKQARDAILASYARGIQTIGEAIGGGVLTGQDMNISEPDARLLFEHASTSIVPYVAGDLSRPPTPPTAVGVRAAFRVAMGRVFPDRADTIDVPFERVPDLCGIAIAVQGVGGVGGQVLLPWLEAGAKIIAADVNPGTVSSLVARESDLWAYFDSGSFFVFAEERLPDGRFSSYITDPLRVYPQLRERLAIDHIDVFAPFAVGGILNDFSITALYRAGVRLVVGSANDASVDRARHPRMMHEMGILYIPDYIANAGGLLVVDGHLGHAIDDRAIFDRIAGNVRGLLDAAQREGGVPQEIADRLARRFFEELEIASLPQARQVKADLAGGGGVAGRPGGSFSRWESFSSRSGGGRRGAVGGRTRRAKMSERRHLPQIRRPRNGGRNYRVFLQGVARRPVLSSVLLTK